MATDGPSVTADAPSFLYQRRTTPHLRRVRRSLHVCAAHSPRAHVLLHRPRARCLGRRRLHDWRTRRLLSGAIAQPRQHVRVRGGGVVVPALDRRRVPHHGDRRRDARSDHIAAVARGHRPPLLQPRRGRRLSGATRRHPSPRRAGRALSAARGRGGGRRDGARAAGSAGAARARRAGRGAACRRDAAQGASARLRRGPHHRRQPHPDRAAALAADGETGRGGEGGPCPTLPTGRSVARARAALPRRPVRLRRGCLLHRDGRRLRWLERLERGRGNRRRAGARIQPRHATIHRAGRVRVRTARPARRARRAPRPERRAGHRPTLRREQPPLVGPARRRRWQGAQAGESAAAE
mmetsp:Transcript_13846/g.44450  ORF Transcript_13846/g.44450 Transcript_13846/m.44450 type:complete len:352 (+) Transcript_13846:252-1307(+)